MAHKILCDRCGKEIIPRQLFRPNGKPYDVVMEYTFKRYGYGRKKWELCYDCAKAVREFLNCHDDYAVIGDLDYDDDDDALEEEV